MTRGPLTFKGTDLKRAIKHHSRSWSTNRTGRNHQGWQHPCTNDNAAQLDDDWDKALADEGR
jgi:hypothetical protein